MISPNVTVRIAQDQDIPAIEALARRATSDLLGPYLSRPQKTASMEFTPLDPWLIEDGMYFVVEIEGSIRASGGWSFRDSLVHDNESGKMPGSAQGEDIARMRALYTDPLLARKGWGRTLVALIEASARTSGCRRMMLLATPVGRLLYEDCGYDVVLETELTATNGVTFRVAHMTKDFGALSSGDLDELEHRAVSRNTAC